MPRGEKTPFKVSDTLPEWMKYVAKDALLSAKEIAPIFGVKKQVIFTAVHRGKFPQPDYRQEFHPGHRFGLVKWMPETIIKEWKRRKAKKCLTER